MPSIYFCLYEKEKEQKSKGIKTDIKNRFEIRLKSGKAEQTIEQLVFSRNPEQTIASLILTQIDFPVYILWDIFLDNVTTSLPFIMTPVAVNMDKTKRWLERQVMPSLLMIKEIEKQTGANYLERNFIMLSGKYQKEQIELEQQITNLREELSKMEQDMIGAEKSIELIKEYSVPKELTAPLLNAMIEKILIHEATTNEDNERIQEIEIYYRFIGKVD